MKVAMNGLAAVALLLLTALCFEVHELSHHFLGWALCGRLGSVTFTQFEVAPGCGVPAARAVELFGPLVSMALAYAGAFLVRKRSSWFGLELTFASYFHLRFLPALLGGGGDEVDLARQTGWFHGSPYAVAIVLFAVALPPLLVAGRALEGRWKWAVFALGYLLPLPVLALSDRFDLLFTGRQAPLPALVSATWLNVPLIVLVVVGAFAMAFVVIAKFLDPSALVVRLGKLPTNFAGGSA